MGTGGMRYGAGRPGRHVKAEHVRRIDARRWAREGFLQSRCNGVWGWTDADTGKVLASIGHQSDGHTVTLTYNMNDKPMRQHVPILTTGCTYGGRRYWFGCPCCGRRVAILYLRARGFACRRCSRVAYASQSEDALRRAWRKQSKIERQLGEHWHRPKGMHMATHERLMRTIIDCEQRRKEALAAFIDRLGLRP